MRQRNVVTVVVLGLVTLGIYQLVWTIKTKGEMNERGAGLPTAWLILVPLVNIWWAWRYAQGVEFVTSGRMSAAVAFLLLWLLPFIGAGIVQDQFNKEPQTAPLPLATAVR